VKLFDKAIVRLTIVYTTILLALSVGFSVAFYSVTNHELDRSSGPEVSDIFDVRLPDNTRFRTIIDQRDDEIRSNLLFGLVFINTAVLLLGAVVSYFLARLTLKPVNEAMESQSRFVSDASHELRTPLAAMAMENEVTLRSTKTSKKELLAQVESNLEEVGKLQELTNRLLKLGQIDVATLEQVMVRQVAKTAVKTMQKAAAAQQIKLAINIAAKDTLTANADLLAELLTALLDNAIKYSPRGATVTLGYANGALYVSDAGPGIADADLPYIFDRFYRSEKSRTSTGFGLGLSLAQRLADQMGLKITVQNNSTKGTTFFVS
jgi:signal transduction histidine kinase